MSEGHMNHEEHQPKTGFNWYKFSLWGSMAIIGYFLVTEHRAHLNAYTPYLGLIAFGFMHIFMHGSHGGHGNHSNDTRSQEDNNIHNHGNKKNKESI